MTVVQQTEPVKEFLVWAVGPLQTTYNDNVLLTSELLVNTYSNYQKLGRRLSLDKGHNVSDPTLPIEQRVSIGTYNLELRNNNSELWAVDIVFCTPELEYKASMGQFGIYISQEFVGLDVMGNPVQDLKLANSFDIERVTLTDDPATLNARPVIKLSRYLRLDSVKAKLESNPVTRTFRTLGKHPIINTSSASRVVIDCMPFKNRNKR